MKAIYSIGYTFSTKSFAFILNYMVINFLLLSEYGQFSIIFSIINSFIVVSSLGLLYSANVISSKWMLRNPKYVLNYFKISFLLIFILSLIFSLIIFYIHGYFISVFLTILIFSLVTLFEGFFYGVGEIKKIFLYGVVNLILSLSISLFFIKSLGLDGAIFSLAISKIFLLVMQVRYFFKNIEFDDFFTVSYIKAIFLFYKKYNFPLVMSALIATPIVTLTIYILSIRKGLEEVAVFSWCYQIYLLGMFIPTALGTYYLSILNKKSNEDKFKVMRGITKFNLIVTIVAIAMLFLVSPLILKVGKIEGFKSSYYIYNTFLICMFFYSLNLGFLSFWSSIGENSFYLKMQILWSLVVLIVVLIFVDFLGGVSIPLGMALGFFIQYLIQLLRLKNIQA